MHAAVRGVIGAAEDSPGHVTILDTEASTEHLLVSTAKHAQAMFAVVEPYFTSLETGRRVNMLATDLGIPRVALIANKVRSEQDVEVVEEFAAEEGLEVVGAVPWDDCFHEAERESLAPIDFAPESEAMAAIARLAPRLLSSEAAAPSV